MKVNAQVARFVSEFFGTFFLVVFGVGAVNEAVLTGELHGAGQVLLVWGVGCTLAVYLSAQLSGGHINPAISAAFAIVRPSAFNPKFLLSHLLGQFSGGFLGGLTNFALWQAYMRNYEEVHGIQLRSSDQSKVTSIVFGGMYPNPALDLPDEAMPWYYALCVEAWITFLLAFVVFMLTDKNNKAVPAAAVPMLVGFTIAVLVGLYEALTVAAFNPARDFGPRFAAFLLGWGKEAIPGPRNGFWVYLIGPLIGGPLGGAAYDYSIGWLLEAGYGDEGDEDKNTLEQPLLEDA